MIENKVDNSKEPLGLPRGSVRALLAITIIAGSLVLYAIGKPVPDWMITMAGTAFGFYFGNRSAETKK